MNLHSLLNFVLFLCILIKFTTAISNPTYLTGDVSINCGSEGNSAANNGRKWIGDVRPKLSFLLQMKGSSTTSTVTPDLISSDPVPHKTARISRTQFSYEFQVSPGQKILRLHFNPTLYKGFKGFNDLFTVETGRFTLLGNFSASLTADALGVDSFVREFCLNIHENQHLNLFFSPDVSRSLDTYAFINGIEIFSVHASLSYFEGGHVGLQRVGEKYPAYIDSNAALEIIHQVKIKKNNQVQSAGDFDGTSFPKWAARKAIERNNNTWKMPVDVGFKYLIRVHLSALGVKTAESVDNVLEVLINEMMADLYLNETNVPSYRDYMLTVRGNKNEGKRDILISLKSYDDRGLVSGFEIFKLSNYDNSLASPNPLPLARDSPSDTVQALFSVIVETNAIGTVAIAVISLVCIVVHNLLEIPKANITERAPSSGEEISPNSLKTFVEQHETKQPLEIAATVRTVQPTIFYTTVQNSTPPQEQNNNNVVMAQFPNNDNKDGPSVQTGQPTIFLTGEQNFTPPSQEQTNRNVVIAQLPLEENELQSLQGTSSPVISESRSTSDLCRRFSLEEIKAATCNFGNNSVIHKGFFSDVYKGLIEDGATTVAIKRLNPKTAPDTHEFLDITKTLSKLRHLHLVSPLGYCDEGGEMILVYNYMAHGSLRDRLNNSEKYPPLTWKQRLQICVGAAKGLHHCLHTGVGDRNMHRNINTANILLDEEWVAKFCVAPNHIRHEKDSAYSSFALVLFHVLFFKAGELPKVTEWAESCRTGAVKQYMDTNLYNQIAPECLSKFVETTLACRNRNVSEQLAMSDVVRSLELAVQLQEAAEQRGSRRWWGWGMFQK